MDLATKLYHLCYFCTCISGTTAVIYMAVTIKPETEMMKVEQKTVKLMFAFWLILFLCSVFKEIGKKLEQPIVAHVSGCAFLAVFLMQNIVFFSNFFKFLMTPHASPKDITW